MEQLESRKAQAHTFELGPCERPTIAQGCTPHSTIPVTIVFDKEKELCNP
jgi:hypothetical protein